MAMELVYGVEKGARLRFTPFPLIGFNGERGMFLCVKNFTRNGLTLTEWSGWRQFEALLRSMGIDDYRTEMSFVGAGIMRADRRFTKTLRVSFFSLVSFASVPKYGPEDCDMSISDDGDGGLRFEEKLPLLDDLPCINGYASGSWCRRSTVCLSKILPPPNAEFLKIFAGEGT